MKECSIKIIRLPSFFRKRQFSSRINSSLIPPLGTGLIFASLSSKGIKIEQDDLNIKINYDNNYSSRIEDKIDPEVFFDISRINRYAQGSPDQYLDSLMLKAAEKVSLSAGQIILLSLPDNIENDTNLTFAAAFSSFIKREYHSTNIIGGESLWLDLLRSKCSCAGIDYIIYGEGETVLDYVLVHLTGGRDSLESAPGILVEEGGKFIRSELIARPIKPDFTVYL
jgi:hypothetical protein